MSATATASVTRTRIVHRDFICKGDDHHAFRAAVKVKVTDTGEELERSAEFLAAGDSMVAWLPIPLCVPCGAIAEEAATYNPSSAQVPSSERLVAWLSPDGQRVAIPGRSDAPMRERYAVAGYTRIEASSMRDMDRVQSIRERQTGNEVVNEMNFDQSARNWHDEAPYDSDDMTNPI